MEVNSLPPDPKASVVYDSDALEHGTVDNMTVADLSNATQSNYPIEALEVRDEGKPAHSPTSQPPPSFFSANPSSVPFSRKRAATVSLAITLIVIIFTGTIMGVLVKGRLATKEAANRDVPTQGVTLESSDDNTRPVELKNDQRSLLVSGDIITRGELRVASDGFASILKSQPLTVNQTITLPAASGTVCLDTNNCNFASQSQLADVQGQIVDATTVNGNSGDITLQGTENQVSVTTNGQTVTFTTPQNLHTAASIQFANLRLNGALRTDTIRTHTTGGDLTVTADTDQLFFVDRSRTFSFPAGGLASQTICTSQNNCNYGTGNGDIVNGGQIGPIVIGTDDASVLQFETNNTTRIALQSNGNIAMNTDTLFVDATNNRVGIGTATPSAKLSVTGGSVLVAGTHGGGNGITVTGAGTRMFFDTNKSAFRTGAVSGSQWDNANVGSYSFAGGRNSTASGSFSFAYGEGVGAPGQSSIALGAFTFASNPFALAVGFDSETNGMASQVLGYGLSMRTFAGMATGYCNYSSGSQNSTSWASADQLFVIGNGTYDAGISDCSLRQNALEMTKNGNLAVDTNTLFVDATNNRVGIGTATPSAKLDVSGGSLLVTGTHTGTSEISVTGSGTRMFFDVGRSAFRAGAAVGNSWDPDWMGLHSAAFGQNTRASQWGFAAGQSTTAASQAVAFGAGTNASGTASSALGWNTTAQAFGSMAIGQCNVAQGTTGSLVSTDTAFAVGNGTYNGGTQSCDSRSNAFQVAYNGSTTVNGGSMLVQGTHGGGNGISVTGAGTRMFFDVNKSAFRAGSTATSFFDDANVGQYSFAAGNNVLAFGNGSAALGVGSRADWDNAMAFGFNARGAGAQAMAMGYYTQSQAYASQAFGVCNAYSGNTSSWNATDQLFTIGNGTLSGLGLSCATRANALEMTKNGNLAVDTNTLYVDAVNNRVGIGTATPISKLEVVESSTDTTAAGLSGATITVTDTGVVTTGTDSTSGLSVSVTRTGATGGTIQVIGGSFNAIGDTGGNSVAVGVQGLGVNTDDSVGVQGFGFISGSGARNSAIGVNGSTGTYFASSPTITTAYGLQGSVAMDSGVATITNAAGLNIKTATNIAGGTITNNYGIRVENQTAGASDYGLYVEGADTYALWVDDGVSRFDGNLEVDTDTLFVDATANRVGIGTATPSAKLHVVESSTSAVVDALTGAYIQVTDTGAVNGGFDITAGLAVRASRTGAIDGIFVTNGAQFESDGDTAGNSLVQGINAWARGGDNSNGVNGVATVTGSGTYASIVGVQGSASVYLASDAAVTDAVGLQGSVSNTSSAAYTNGVGLNIKTAVNSGAGSIINNYGLRVENQTAGASDYGLYIEGADTYALWVDSGASRLDGTLTVAEHAAVGAGAIIDGVTLAAPFLGANSFNSVLTVAEDITDFSKDFEVGIVNGITANPTAAYSGAIIGIGNEVALGGSESVTGLVAGSTNIISTTDSIDVDTVYGSYNIVALSSTGDVAAAAANEVNTLQVDNAITGSVVGSINQVGVNGTGGGAAAGAYSILSAGTSPEVTGLAVDNSISGGTVTNQNGITIALQSSGGSTVTTAVGLQISDVVHTGTVTDSYGVRVGTSSGAANNYGVYVAGGGTYAVWVDDGVSRFDGNVAINATTAANKLNLNTLTTADAAAQLAVSTDGTTNKGVVVQGVASQSADLFQAQDSTGAVLASISAAGDLTVETATINGTLTVNGNATINGHVISGNTSGSTTVATGAAADCSASGLANISGNDTAGTITITTSTGTCSAGTLATITFANAYGNAPEVVITPKDASGASLQYYNGSATTAAFTIDTGVGATTSTVYTYSYHVIE